MTPLTPCNTRLVNLVPSMLDNESDAVPTSTPTTDFISKKERH